VEGIWVYVGEKDAVTTARALARTFDGLADRLLHEDLGVLLAVLGNGAQEEASAVATRCLAQALRRERDWRRFDDLCSRLREVVGRLPAEDAAATAQAVVAKLDKEGFRRALELEAAALTILASRLGEQDAAAAVRVVARRMTERVDSTDPIPYLVGTLAALAGRLPRDEAAAVVAPTVRTLTRALAGGAPGLEANAVALATLAERLADADAAAAFRAAAGRLAGAKSSTELAGVGKALAALAGRLDRKETGGVPAAAAAALVERLAVEKEWKVPAMLAAALADLGRRLDEGELVGLLGAPLCRGEARALVLGELGRRAGRPFADVWEFAEWARVHRPDLDLRSAATAARA
jgi:hypothetical protein